MPQRHRCDVCDTDDMIRLGSVVMGCEDVPRAAAFWAAALGYDTVPLEGTRNEFTILRPPSGVGTRIGLQRAETPVQEHPRVHIDVIVASAAEQQAEVERLLRLGAARVDWDEYPDDPDFIVLADTEGNRFCVVNADE